MSVAKIIEVSAQAPGSFEAAIKEGLAKASESVENIQSAWIKEQEVLVRDNAIVGYKVLLKVTFVVK